MIFIANTVNSAFSEFLKDKVNLDSFKTKKARKSRDWLNEKIHNFDNEAFPKLCNKFDINFGSFARLTKIRELDDIDIMIGLNAQGSYYSEKNEKIEITIGPDSENLEALCFDNSKSLNSKKVINKFKTKMNEIPQYEKSEIKRNFEAVTLKLKSYTWNFDIVPCFFTKPDNYRYTFFLIPDGYGNWKKTDPRIDRERVTKINQKHDGKILNIIRVMKYWNKMQTMPSVSSYAFENLILDYFDSKGDVSDFIDLEIIEVLLYLVNAIKAPINDPKRIQDDLNDLTYEEKIKISKKAFKDYEKAKQAREKENVSNMKEAISLWGEVFGTAFPSYSQ